MLAEKGVESQTGQLTRQRKRPADSQRKTLSGLAMAIKKSPMVAIQILNRQGCICYWNQGCEHLYGYKPSEVLGHHFQEILASDEEAAEFEETLSKILDTGQATSPDEFKIRRHSGEEGWMLSSLFPILQNGIVEQVFCIDIDITEHKRAEEHIKDLSKFPSENPFPVLRVGGDGTILYSNAAGLCVLRQWEREVGQSVPSNWRELIATALHSKRNQITEIRSENSIFSFVITPVVEYGYVNAYGHDVTAQKKAEYEMMKLNEELENGVNRLERDVLQVSEREKRLIGQELHDSLGQQFVGIALMAQLLSQRLADKLPSESANAGKIAKLANQAMEQARELAWGLHPIGLNSSSLGEALGELASSTERLFGLHCSFRCEREIPVSDSSAAVHLYRIAQEALTNAIKHGRAKNAQIRLTCGATKSVLTVKSDGVGFREGMNNNTGMGLQIMNYRAAMIGGSLNVHKCREGGTILSCVFPNKSTAVESEVEYGIEKTAS
ncbi:MAG: PAS domain-containing sensor histidine kinase [Planctomycetota bacterium]|jgi:PAS domain S-box-containing protein